MNTSGHENLPDQRPGLIWTLSIKCPSDFWKMANNWSVWDPLDTSGFRSHSPHWGTDCLQVDLSGYVSLSLLIWSSLCPSVGLHLSDRVWPHVSWSTTMSVDRNRKAAWKPAFLEGPQHWQLRPSRTTSNVTHCWHYLSTHSVTPVACSFLHTSLLSFYGKDPFRGRCVCVCGCWQHLCAACVHARCSVFFSTSWELLRICSYISQDMLNVTTRTCHLPVL